MRQDIGDRYVLFTKVRLGDIFYAQRVEGWQGWTNRINAKHVDFLLCEPMVLRTAAKGERSGEQFWGCVNYPRCREMRRVE